MRCDAIIDVKRLVSPMVLMRFKMRVEEIPAGSRVELLLNDLASEDEIQRYCEKEGHSLSDRAVVNGIIRYLVTIKS